MSIKGKHIITGMLIVYLVIVLAVIILQGAGKLNSQGTCVAVLTDKNGIKHEINGTIKGEL